MGLILPQTVKVRTNPSNCKHYKEKGYTFKKCGDFIEINVLDLSKGSGVKVKVICDICGKESEMWYCTVVKCNEKNELITCGSNSCKNKKYEDTCMKKYGVKNVAQSQEIQDKIKDTNLERYGCMYSLQSQVVREKIENTNLERYGSKSSLGSKEIRNKSKKTWQKNYGENITNPSQAEEVKEKIKQTNLERHGCEYPMQNTAIRNKANATCQEKYGGNSSMCSEEIQNKAKATCQEKYGGNSAMCSEEIQNKSKTTCLLHWGVNNPFQSYEIKEKIKATNLEKHGAENPMQCDEIKNKVLDSFQFNGTGPCSRQQKYIHFLIGGTLNKRVCNSLADIYMEKENIIIEHDGRGHFLGDIINGNKTPTKEALLREKEREDKIISNGYRMIRFIATKDRIPSDEVILNLIEGFKNSDFKVIRINFEEGTIEKDYNEKSHYDFGELRRITKEDLEQFESEKTINLK